MGSFLIKILTSGMLEKVLQYFESKDKNETAVLTEEIKAEIERRRVQKEVIAIEHGWWVTAWIRPLLVYPFILHIATIVLDTVFNFGWAIPPLPGLFQELEIAIVMSYFITRPIEKGIRSYIHKK
jgi:hypothetical protein